MALTARRLRRLEAWSTWRAAGGTRQAVIPDAIAARVSAQLENEQLVVTLPLDSLAAASLGVRKVIAVDQDDAHANDIPWSYDLTHWTVPSGGNGSATLNAVGIDGSPNKATTLADTSALLQQAFVQIATPADTALHYFQYRIRKDAVNAPLVSLWAALVTPSTLGRRLELNTSTGAFTVSSAGSPTFFNERVTSSVDGLWWVVEMVVQNDGTRTAAQPTIYIAGPTATDQRSEIVGHVQHETNQGMPALPIPPIVTTGAAVTVAAIFDEYQIVDRSIDHEQGVLVVTAAPFRLTDLQGAGLIFRKDSDGTIVHDFEVLGLTPLELVTNWVVPALAAAGFGYIGVGTITPGARLDMTFAWDTPLSALLRIQSATNSELSIRNSGTSGFFIEIVTKVNSGAQTADLRIDKNLVNVVRSESSLDQATRVFPKGSSEDGMAATMSRATWQIATLSGTTIGLADPAGGAPPIGFDAQLSAKYLRKPDGSLTLITNSLAATQEIVVASVAGLAVGDIVQFRANVAGDDLVFLENPAAASLYGVKAAVREVTDVPATNNLVKNPAMRAWPGSSSAPPTNWTAVNAPTIAKQTAAPFTAIGGNSIKVTSTTDGQGVISDAVTLSPTTANPYLSGFAKVWVASGNARVELVIATPSGTKVFPLLPDLATPLSLGQWFDVGAAGFDAFAAAATSAQIRVLQNGTVASVFYVDAAQITQTATQMPWFEGSGATRLWQEANEALRVSSSPMVSYSVPLVDLEACEPAIWSESALILGANAHIVDPQLAVDVVTRIVGIERDYFNPQATSITLSNRFDDLTDLLSNVIRPERTGDDTTPVTIPQQPKLSASFDINGQLIINSTGDNDVVSQKIAYATGSAPSSATVRAASAINQQNISGLATGSIYAQGTTVFIAAYAYNTRGLESAPLTVISVSRQGAIIDYTPFASNLTPIKLVSSLPASGAFVGEIVFLTTDKKLYRWTGSAWTSATDAIDITGQIATGQIADSAITAAKIGAAAVIAGKIAANAVGSTEIASLSVTNAKIAAQAVDTAKLAALAVTTAELAALAVTGAKIAANTITAANIAAHTISAAEIAALTITAAEIATGAIIAAKISAGAITAGKLSVGLGGAALNSDPDTADITAWDFINGTTGSIVTLTDGKVGNTALRSSGFSAYRSHVQPYDKNKSYRVRLWARRDSTATGVLYAGIGVYDAAGAFADINNNYFYVAAAAVIPAANTWVEYTGVLPVDGLGSWLTTPVTMSLILLLDYAVGVGYYEVQDVRLEEVTPGTLIMDGSIITNKLAANAVTAGKIAADTITAAEIQAGAITSSELAANSVVAGKIAALTIVAADIAALTITGAKIAAGTISADKLVANSITAGQIQAGAISATELAAGAVTAGKIAAGVITTTEIAAGGINADRITAGTITADRIVANSIGPALTVGRGSILGYKTNSQTLTTGSLTQMALDNAEFALGTGVVRSANQFVINDAIASYGSWVLVAQVGFAASTAGDRHVEIRKNGTVVGQSTVRACANASTPTIIPVVAFVSGLAISDAFDVYISQDTGGNLAVRVTRSETFFSMSHLW